MNSKLLTQALLGVALSIAAVSSFAASTPEKLLGTSASTTAAERTVQLSSDTKYINVIGGQTVEFNVNGKTFAWTFDGSPSAYTFDLQTVAPSGVLDHAITVYVSANPTFAG